MGAYLNDVSRAGALLRAADALLRALGPSAVIMVLPVPTQQDNADLERILKQFSIDVVQKTDPKVVEQIMPIVFNKSSADRRPLFAELHTPPLSFQRGKPFTVVANVSKTGGSVHVVSLNLRYRHVNQAELWQSIDMEKTGEDYRALIASDYTDSPYPLQYHFQVRSKSGNAWLHPGLENRWQGQPYFFLRQAQS